MTFAALGQNKWLCQVCHQTIVETLMDLILSSPYRAGAVLFLFLIHLPLVLLGKRDILINPAVLASDTSPFYLLPRSAFHNGLLKQYLGEVLSFFFFLSGIQQLSSHGIISTSHGRH
jgi:hypothetical protein